MCFQGNIAGNSVFFSCLSRTGIIVIPADKFMTVFRTIRKRNGITDLCSDISTFHLPSVCIKSNCACGCPFLYIAGFQGDIIRDSVFFPCLTDTGIAIIPAYKLITVFRTVRKCDRIADPCSDISTFHLPSVCIKSNGCFFLFPCGIVGSVLLRGIMLLPCIPCKYSQRFIFIPAFKAVAFSGSVRECNICSGDHLLAVCLPFPVIINISKGNRLFGFPLHIKVEVPCQVCFLSGFIISSRPVRFRVPPVKIIPESHNIPHEWEKCGLIHNNNSIFTGIFIGV